MINSYELRKIYIAELGFDPHLQMALRSEHKVRSAKKEIQRIMAQYTDPYEAEGELLKIVKQAASRPRQREYAGLLLQFGFEGFTDKNGDQSKPLISAEAYEYARENYFGVKEIDDKTKEKIDSMKKRDLRLTPFDYLEGKKPYEDPKQRLQKLDTQPQPQQQIPNPMGLLDPNQQ